jgi:hypothetical protein
MPGERHECDNTATAPDAACTIATDDDVPSDQNSPYWPTDFWAPVKFIPLDIAPGSYINFPGEDRERVEHYSNPFFALTPRGNTTYDLHRLLFEGDLHIGDTFRVFTQFGNHLATSPSTSPPTDVDRLDLQQGFASYGQKLVTA